MGELSGTPRTKWLQLPVDSPLALTRPVGLKVDDHFFTSYTAQQRDSRSLVGGQEHMEHIEHVFSYIIPGLAPRGRSVLAAFLQSFLQKYVFHVFCVFSQRKSANAVCSVMCSNVFTGERAGIISSPFCATCASFRHCCRNISRSRTASRLRRTYADLPMFEIRSACPHRTAVLQPSNMVHDPPCM